jgi:signal transduction histidine kinase
MGYLTIHRPRDVRALCSTQKSALQFLKIAVRLSKANSGSFILLNPNTGLLEIEAAVGLSKRASRLKLRLGQGITGWVATTGKLLRIPNVNLERKYISVNPKIRSEMAVPVEWKGQVIGIINLDSHQQDHFESELEEPLRKLAGEAAEWLTYAWEIQKMHLRDQQLTTLVGMGRSIVSQGNLDEALERITRDAARLMKTKVCSLMLLSPDKQKLILRASYGTGINYINRAHILVEESLIGVVVNRRRHLNVLNVQTDHRYQNSEMARQENLVSLLAVPLVFGAETIGILSVYTQEPHRFSNDEIKLLQTLADLSAVAIEKNRILARVVETEEMLRQSERLSALGLLATEVAHEIRNPLTVMQMLFHSLMSHMEMTPDARQDVVIIEEKMRQMNKIVAQVLNLARSTEPVLAPIEVVQMLDDTLLLIRHKLSQQQVAVSRIVAESLPLLYADRTQLEQVLLNLVLNAVDAMPEGGNLRLGAQVRETAESRYMVLSVRDNGQGMTQEQANTLFLPFLTTKQQGTGIGMAIVQKIMENHRGKITVTSRKGRGTLIRLWLPLDRD